MQPRLLTFILGIGFLGMLCLTPPQVRGDGACGGAFYGGAFQYGGPVYHAPYRTAYAPPRTYGAPMYGQSYPSSPSTYRQPDSSAPMYGQSRSAPPARMRPTTTIDVVMYDDNFQPQSINVQPGTTVRWTNNGTHTHTVTARNGSWDSGDIRPGATYSATFQQVGTYDYFCRHHDGMQGAIVVGRAAASGYARPRSSGY